MTLWFDRSFTGSPGTFVTAATEPGLTIGGSAPRYIASTVYASGIGVEIAPQVSSYLTLNAGGRTRWRLGFRLEIITLSTSIVPALSQVARLLSGSSVRSELALRGVVGEDSAGGGRWWEWRRPNPTPIVQHTAANRTLAGTVWSVELFTDNATTTAYLWQGTDTSGPPVHEWSFPFTASAPTLVRLGSAGNSGVRFSWGDVWATDGERRSAAADVLFPSAGGITPTNGYDDGGAGMAVGSLFAVSQPCQLVGVRWWAPFSGTIVLPQLWTEESPTAGTMLAEGPAHQSVQGWNQLWLTSPIDLTPGVDYVAVAHEPTAQHYGVGTAPPVPHTVGPAFNTNAVGSRFAYSSDSTWPRPAQGSGAWFGVDAMIVGGDDPQPPGDPWQWLVRIGGQLVPHTAVARINGAIVPVTPALP